MDVKIVAMQIILNFTNSKLTILCGWENIGMQIILNFTDTVIVNRQYSVDGKIIGMQIILNFTNSKQKFH